MRDPGSLACAGTSLLQPVDTVVVAPGPNEVAIPVFIDIAYKNGNTRIRVQRVFLVPLPFSLASVNGRFKPSVRPDYVTASVVVEIAKTQSVRGNLDREVMAYPA